MIKSISYSQDEIINNILSLYLNNKIDLDASYGNGQFYKNINVYPELKYDIDSNLDDVDNFSSTELPNNNLSLESVVFDPPFLTYIKKGREHDSIMAKRFSGYYSYDELKEHYELSIKEFSRVIKRKGFLVFKCQDIIHNHKMHCTHKMVIDMAEKYNFRVKDIFILLAKHRMGVGKNKTQRHARVYHSYFLVFEKLKTWPSELIIK